MVHGFGHTAVRLRRALGRGRERRAARHAVRDRPADGRHGHERQLRHHRGGGVSDGTVRHGHRHPPLRRVHGLRGRLQDREPRARGLQPRLDRVRDRRHVSRPCTMEIRSERCNHCDNPPCVTCCPTGASHVDQFGGVVLVTPEECIGCKACLASCPYDARFVHPDGYADKCTFCVHRVKEGLDPACVAVCPTHCFTSATSTTPTATSAGCWRRGRRTRSCRRPAPSRASSTWTDGDAMTPELFITRHNRPHRSRPPRLELADPGLPVPRRLGGRQR